MQYACGRQVPTSVAFSGVINSLYLGGKKQTKQKIPNKNRSTCILGTSVSSAADGIDSPLKQASAEQGNKEWPQITNPAPVCALFLTCLQNRAHQLKCTLLLSPLIQTTASVLHAHTHMHILS